MSALSSTLGGPSSSVTSSGIASQFSQLTSEDFVKIMMTELTSQDPLKPNDSNSLLQQFSSLRNIESSLSLQNKLTDVVSQNQLSTAGSLLGKYVTGYTENFDAAEGIVGSVSQTADGPVLNLKTGARIPFKNVQEILEPPTDTTGTTGTTGTNGTNGTTPVTGVPRTPKSAVRPITSTTSPIPVVQ
jgi:flagellar basal-body rod modification protein FlgD